MKTVCLGDSLTDHYNVAPEACWVSLLNRETLHTWINQGISGDTSPGLLTRLQTEAFPQNPDMVLWMGGDNDIMLTGSADLAKPCLMAMLHQCTPRGVKPVIGIPIPALDIPQRWKAVCDWKRHWPNRPAMWLGCGTLPPPFSCGGWILPGHLKNRDGRCICQTECIPARQDTGSWPKPCGKAVCFTNKSSAKEQA